MKLALISLAGFGLLAFGAEAQPASDPVPAPVKLPVKLVVDADSVPANKQESTVKPPADLEGDDSGDYMKHMTSAELEKLYAQHDAEVARLMAAAPDEPLLAALAYVDPETGERTSIDLVAF